MEATGKSKLTVHKNQSPALNPMPTPPATSQPEPPLRVVVDATHLIPGHTGGSEIYLTQVLRHMAPLAGVEATLLLSREAEGFYDGIPRLRQVRTGVRAGLKPARFAWQQTRLPSLIARMAPDVAWFPMYFAPLRLRVPSAVVIHDTGVMRFARDFPLFARLLWRAIVPRAARRCSAVITGSQFSRGEIETWYRVPPQRIHVIPYGGGETAPAAPTPADRDIVRSHGITRPYLLSVAYTHPHKNLPNLVRAFTAQPMAREFQLVLIGGRGTEEPVVEALARQSGGSVVRTGHLPREHVDCLYRQALAFVFPTLYEGFGMPVLEAMRNGLPVVCSDLPVLREVAGDAAGYFDPLDRASIGTALARVAGDGAWREALRAQGAARLEVFSWERCAAGHVALFRELAQSARPGA